MQPSLPGSPPRFFATPAAFREWLLQNHQTAPELFVGFYKKGSGRLSITWPESVDQALCFGWIDGVRRSIDEDSYMIRFTPRRPNSIWSAVNLAKIDTLTRAGLMHPSGARVFAERNLEKSKVYAFEQPDIALTAEQEKVFRQNKAAWKFFSSLPASYRKTATWWVISAKQDKTRMRRLDTLIADSAAGQRLKQLRPD